MILIQNATAVVKESGSLERAAQNPAKSRGLAIPTLYDKKLFY